MYIDRLLVQKEAPKDTKVAWAKPEGENIELNIFNNGKWRPIAGSGNSTTVTNKYTSDPSAPMLSGDSFSGAMMEAATKLGFGTDSEPTLEQYEQIFNELKSYKFATPKQGNAVLLDHDLENNIFTFQCDDGSIITFNSDHGEDAITGLRPDIDGYLIWKTTRDKLPVRESQEETDPEEPNLGDISPKSVKPGPILKATSGESSEEETPEDTEEVYTVINNNTGEIIDPLELHKLTNVIYDFNVGDAWWISTVSWQDQYSEDDTVSSWISIGNSSRPNIIFCFYMYNYILQYPTRYYQLSGTWQSMSE